VPLQAMRAGFWPAITRRESFVLTTQKLTSIT
jgi:hypothetical protein